MLMRFRPVLPAPEAIEQWLPSQRWFAAKTKRIGGVAFADVIPLGRGVVLLVDVELDGGRTERYAVPLIVGEEIVDALGDAGFARELIGLLERARAVSGEWGEVRGAPAAALAERWPRGAPADLVVRRIGGEQSNTSLVVGDAFVLKYFRKLAEGLNPEAEVTRFLTERTGFRNTPRLAGHLEYRDGRGQTTTLAVVQELVPGAVDGWQWVLERLREPGGGSATVDALRRLGERTAELHRALGSDPSDPAFSPEPVTAADVAAWTDAVVDQLASARAALPVEGIGADPRAIHAGLSPLVGRRKIRHHGDFHLGQTLYQPATNDWMIIDFEGEPLRPLAERRRKHAAPRDVAGMLRSIDYAAASAESAATSSGGWSGEAMRAFVEGYRAAAGSAAFLPASDAAFEAVVAVFTLEKAAYEIVYEANNRPAWIDIPRRGLTAAVGRLTRYAA
jgi:trehalose synthase-fused probable maltokinase